MPNVITYGTFDLFHIGHLRILQRAKALADPDGKLFVGISSDAFNAIKGKRCTIPYEQRAEIVQALRYVDGVFPEENWAQKRDDIRKYQIDIFLMGDDWRGKFDDLSDLCQVIYLPRTEGISTTQLKQVLHK